MPRFDDGRDGALVQTTQRVAPGGVCAARGEGGKPEAGDGKLEAGTAHERRRQPRRDEQRRQTQPGAREPGEGLMQPFAQPEAAVEVGRPDPVQRAEREEERAGFVALAQRIEAPGIGLDGHDGAVGEANLQNEAVEIVGRELACDRRDLLLLHDHGRRLQAPGVEHVVSGDAERGDRREQQCETKGAKTQARAEPEGGSDKQHENQRGDRGDEI
jgi:hypothetical protein